MVDVTPPTPPRHLADTPSKRGSEAPSVNELRPSPAIVSWVDRAVQRITRDTPWTYEGESPPASPAGAAPLPEPEREFDRREPRAKTPSQASSTPMSTPRAASLDTRSVPDGVRERFIRMGRHYYFPGGNVAFEDKGKRVVTHSENTEVVRSLVEIAQSRGWQDITVSGTERFRREAWRQATFAGLIARGYQPTEFDKRQFVRDLARSRAPPDPPAPFIDPPRSPTVVPPSGARTPAVEFDPLVFERDAKAERPEALGASDRRGVRASRPHPTHAKSIPEPAEMAKQPPRGARGGAKRSRVYAGRLIEHGEARYKFNDDKEPSYFVRLETENGPKELWGVDFPRALNQAGVEKGDLIEVELTARKSVAVKRPARDADGRILGEEEVSAHRNEWDVRAQARRANGASSGARSQPLQQPLALARESARENPALTHALAALRAAELLADARIRDATVRGQFVEGVRAQLARVLDADTMPPAPQLRERAVERARTSARVLS
jgi:hypothetical protein